MDKINSFFNGIFKCKMDLSKIGGLEGLEKKIKALANGEGQVDLAKLKKMVMPFASQFLGDSVKKFFEDNKDKTTVSTDDALNFFKENIKVDAKSDKTADAPDAGAAAGGEAGASESKPEEVTPSAAS